MKALVIFGKENSHPMAWLLNRDVRHVWCAVQRDDQWAGYDWHQGVPVIQYLAGPEYDLASHLRGEGWKVVETTVGEDPVLSPLILNSCVGHTKLVLGIRNWALTPHGLLKRLRPKMQHGWRGRICRYMSLPGQGAGIKTGVFKKLDKFDLPGKMAKGLFGVAHPHDLLSGAPPVKAPERPDDLKLPTGPSVKSRQRKASKLLIDVDEEPFG